MKIYITRWKFDRITQGLTPAQKEQLAETVVFYPEHDEPVWRVDQERVAADLVRLTAEQTRVPPFPPPPAGWPLRRPRRWPKLVDEVPQHFVVDATNVDDSAQLPSPWEKLGPGVWWAPPGTPPPKLGRLGEDPAVEEAFWPLLDEILEPQPPSAGILPAVELRPLDDYTATDLRTDMETAVRYFMNNPVPARRIQAGENALAAIATAAGPKPSRGWPKDPTGQASNLHALTGIPIYCDPDLPPDVWQLVDPSTGEVLAEHTITATLDEHIQVAREAVEQVADEAGIPRDLFFY